MLANYFTDRYQSVKYNKKLSPLMSILLGVPQGRQGSDKDLETLIKRFVGKLKVLLEWCDFNKLGINWSKTFFMFVTNKRIKLPMEVIVDSKTVDIKVSK